MREGDVLYWVWLSLKCGPGSELVDTLVRKYDSPFEIYSLSEDELRRMFPTQRSIYRLCDKDLSAAQQIIDFCFIKDIGIVTYSSDLYPERLRSLSNPPLVLYYRGDFPRLDGAVSVAVVGSRKMTDYGKRMAFEISMDLARAGAIVVSGLALGVDGTAAAGALTGGGTTVAVLGSGIDVIYPAAHARLADTVARNGAVITEYAPGTRPEGRNFPIRNRIISGLCQAVLVVEGDRKTGALITAKHALQQGRELYALPGQVDSVSSEAVNKLIQEGAKVITCADDILKDFTSVYPNKINMFNLLKKTNVNIDDILAEYGVNYIPYISDSSPVSYTTVSAVQEKKIKEKATSDFFKKIRNKKEKENKNSLDEIDIRLKSLDIPTLNIYNLMPKGKSVTPDELCIGGVSIADVMTALTMLEVFHLIKSEPGGRFSKL